jgi:WD40 repeat protein/transcriptional regulator with XRE-family HTH domain
VTVTSKVTITSSHEEVQMSAPISPVILEKFTTFGDLLRYLRRRAGMTQLELSMKVGYSDAQISRLEQNLRLPDIPMIETLFVPTLNLENQPEAVQLLLKLAANVRREDAPGLGLCPYKGLDYFDETDADLFVGRETLTAKLVESVLALAANGETPQERFYTIVGASGSGKSSLVRAGLVPALRWNKVSAGWPIHVLTPSAHPLESLAMALTRENGSVAAIARLIDDLSREPRSLALFIKRSLKPGGAAHTLLVIDQFEELFALCRSEEERVAFINNLLTASVNSDGQAIIVITLRADFYAHCAGYPALRKALVRQQEYIGMMSDEEVRRAIEEPARRGQWEFEPGLVDLIMHDVGHEPGALPLLSHALLETWQRRHGRTMTLSGYISAGGVRGAIAETAETVFVDQFTPAQQAIARRIFLRLTELGDETATGDTRRRAKFNELILKPEESAATQTVIKALADARLITTSADSVEVAHEALIREWPTLRGWLEDNREGLRLHRHLTDAAQEWLESGREPGMLYRGARLVQVHEWAASHAEDMNMQEKEFLAASVALSEKEAAEREAQHQREVEAAQQLADSERQRAEAQRLRAEEAGRSNQRLRQRAIFLGLLSVAAVLLTVAAILFASQASGNAHLAGQNMNAAQAASTQAIAQRAIAQAASTQAVNEAASRATAEAKAVVEADTNHSLMLASAAQQANLVGQQDLSLALALEAVKGNQPPPEALQTLRSVAESPATRRLLAGFKQQVNSVVISPDNKTAFAGSCAQMDARGSCQAGDLMGWDLTTSLVLQHWSAHAGWVNALAFSADGKMLISGGLDGALIMWDAVTGAKIRQLEGSSGGITSLAVEADNNALLSGSDDGTLILWDLKTGSIIRKFAPHNSPVSSVAIASAKAQAVSGHADGNVVLWDLNNPQPLRTIAGNGYAVESVAINHDGSWILSTAGFDLRKINALTGEVENTQAWGGTPGKLALGSDESYVLLERTILDQFDLQNWREEKIFDIGGGGVSAVAISQDEPLGLAGYADGTVRVWDLVEALDYHRFDTPMQADAIAVSPDGKSLLIGNMYPSDRNLVLWDIAGSKVVKTYPGFDGATSPGSIAISPSGRLAAAGGGYLRKPVYNLMVWDLESGDVKCHFTGLSAIPRSIAFSPDSRFLLSGSQASLEGAKNELFLYDVQACQVVRHFDMNEVEDVTGIAFSSDGNRVLTGSAYGDPNRIILWDVSTGKEIRRYSLERGGFSPIFFAAFGPGESTILGADGAALCLWDAGTGKIIRRYNGHTNFPWSAAISPDGKYILSGSENEVILWDFATGQELHKLTAHKQPIYGVTFSPDSQTAFSVSTDGLLVQWKIAEKNLPELLDWIQKNRYVAPLTCEQKSQYLIKPLCSP